MKFSIARNYGPALLLMSSLAGFHAAYAAPAEAPESHGEAGAVTVPATAKGIWLAIDQQSAKLEKVIQSDALDKVHLYAFAIRDLATALPQHSQSLPADQLAQVKGNVQFVATLAERLDASGDANDKAGTRANFTKLKTILEKMRASYLTVAE